MDGPIDEQPWLVVVTGWTGAGTSTIAALLAAEEAQPLIARGAGEAATSPVVTEALRQ